MPQFVAIINFENVGQFAPPPGSNRVKFYEDRCILKTVQPFKDFHISIRLKHKIKILIIVQITRLKINNISLTSHCFGNHIKHARLTLVCRFNTIRDFMKFFNPDSNQEQNFIVHSLPKNVYQYLLIFLLYDVDKDVIIESVSYPYQFLKFVS